MMGPPPSGNLLLAGTLLLALGVVFAALHVPVLPFVFLLLSCVAFLLV